METQLSHYVGSTDQVCCLPCNGKLGKEVINDKVLWMGERQAVLVEAENGETYVASDDAKKNTNY